MPTTSAASRRSRASSTAAADRPSRRSRCATATRPTVAQSLQTVLGDSSGGSGVRVAADPRSNTVIVRGMPAAVAEARRIAASLDQPAARPRSRGCSGSTMPMPRR
ncbi:MAG: secretin N-terminal domain-containing protein [Sphingomonas sp.]